MTKISAAIVADSVNKQRDRITSMLVTFPRFILAEGKTHRMISGMIQETSIGLNDDAMLSKNSASSRAIPFNKMIEAVKNDPFIPVAWQKDHKGMQGTEYHLNPEVQIKTWLEARDYAIRIASNLNNQDCNVTKQLCNRLLEPFMWHTVLITATEWNNFFSLRCPQYYFNSDGPFRSKKDLLKKYTDSNMDTATDIEWLTCNKGQAEIHMMALAEAMWDAMNESTPKVLQPGEWHIPFEYKINVSEDLQKELLILVPSKDEEKINNPFYLNQIKVKISTAMAARTSYTVVGDEKEFGHEKQIELHDRMANQVPFHASPFEHCARAMSDEEYDSYVKGWVADVSDADDKKFGWCRNYKGFIQYREILENENR